MKRILLFAPVVAVLAAPAIAQIAPVPPGLPPPPPAATFSTPAGILLVDGRVVERMPSFSGAPVDVMVARLLSFDRNGDGRVTLDELPERMEPLLARGDTNADGALDAAEIRALASAPLQIRTVGFGPSGRYGFADQFHFSSRDHIEGAVVDLKIAGPAADEARAVARAFADWLDAEARTTLLADLKEVLSTEQLAAFEQALRQPQPAVKVEPTFAGGGGGGGGGGPVSPAIRLLNRFELRPADRAFADAAIERFREQLRIGEAERMALLEALRPWLGHEERDDLRAALARRPMVPLGGVVGVQRTAFR